MGEIGNQLLQLTNGTYKGTHLCSSSIYPVGFLCYDIYKNTYVMSYIHIYVFYTCMYILYIMTYPFGCVCITYHVYILLHKYQLTHLDLHTSNLPIWTNPSQLVLSPSHPPHMLFGNAISYLMPSSDVMPKVALPARVRIFHRHQSDGLV